MPFVNSKGKKLSEEEVQVIINMMREAYRAHIAELNNWTSPMGRRIYGESKLASQLLAAYTDREAQIEKDYLALASSQKETKIETILENDFANVNASVIKDGNAFGSVEPDPLHGKQRIFTSRGDSFLASEMYFWGDPKSVKVLTPDRSIDSAKSYEKSSKSFSLKNIKAPMPGINDINEYDYDTLASVETWDDRTKLAIESGRTLREKEQVSFADVYDLLIYANKSARTDGKGGALRGKGESSSTDPVGSNNIPAFLYDTLSTIADDINQIKLTKDAALRKTQAVQLAAFTASMLGALEVFDYDGSESMEENIKSQKLFANAVLTSFGLPPFDENLSMNNSFGNSLNKTSDLNNFLASVKENSFTVFKKVDPEAAEKIESAAKAKAEEKEKEEAAEKERERAEAAKEQAEKERLDAVKSGSPEQDRNIVSSLMEKYKDPKTAPKDELVIDMKVIGVISRKRQGDEILIDCADTAKKLMVCGAKDAEFKGYVTYPTGAKLVQAVLKSGDEARDTQQKKNGGIKAITERYTGKEAASKQYPAEQYTKDILALYDMSKNSNDKNLKTICSNAVKDLLKHAKGASDDAAENEVLEAIAEDPKVSKALTQIIDMGFTKDDEKTVDLPAIAQQAIKISEEMKQMDNSLSAALQNSKLSNSSINSMKYLQMLFAEEVQDDEGDTLSGDYFRDDILRAAKKGDLNEQITQWNMKYMKMLSTKKFFDDGDAPLSGGYRRDDILRAAKKGDLNEQIAQMKQYAVGYLERKADIYAAEINQNMSDAQLVEKWPRLSLVLDCYNDAFNPAVNRGRPKPNETIQGIIDKYQQLKERVTDIAAGKTQEQKQIENEGAMLIK